MCLCIECVSLRILQTPPFNPSFCFSPSLQDPSFSLLLHDKLQVPNSSRRAWNERDSRCDVCTTHLTQLKQEAVRMVLALDQWDLSPTSSPTALSGRYGFQGPPGPTAACAAGWPPPFLPYPSSSLPAAAGSNAPHAASQSPSPTPSQTPTPSPSHGPSNNSNWSPPVLQTTSTNSQTQSPGQRQGSKPSSLGLGGGADKRNLAPSPGKAGSQQQPATVTSSPSNNVSSSNTGAPLQAHQNPNRTNGGVTLYPYQVRKTHYYKFFFEW